MVLTEKEMLIEVIEDNKKRFKNIHTGNEVYFHQQLDSEHGILKEHIKATGYVVDYRVGILTQKLHDQKCKEWELVEQKHTP